MAISEWVFEKFRIEFVLYSFPVIFFFFFRKMDKAGWGKGEKETEGWTFELTFEFSF